MRNEIVKCKHCKEVIIDCTWKEWTEFRNSKEAHIERHESECKENPVKKEHLNYLDILRESGVTNMYGAGSYIQKEFAVDRREARTILQYWMSNFSKRN